MSDPLNIKKHDYSTSLYLFPLGVFALLMWMRNSEAYGPLFELLPVLGRTIPYFVSSLLVLSVFIFKGGSLAQLGLCWPHKHKSALANLKWIVLAAIAILALRIFVGVASGPLLELLPEKISRSSALVGNLSLMLSLLPLMWAVVMAEELLFRGLIMGFIAKLFGDTNKAWLLAVLISALIFGLCHMGKGSAAMLASGLGGLAYGLGYLVFRKNLWPVILAHCAGNTLGFISAYFDD